MNAVEQPDAPDEGRDGETSRGPRRGSGMLDVTEGREMTFRILSLAIVLLAWSCSLSPAVTVHDGDIVFQTSRSAQSQAIQLATHSAYSHMGIVLYRNGEPFVFEAVAQVRFTPFQEWVRRGEGGRYVAKRLLDSELLRDPRKLSALRQAALAFAGRPYDPYFEWSDDRIYCSELIWKAYDRGLGIQLGALAPLSTFDLSSQLVKAKLVERFGNRVPSDERVISPSVIFDSPLLERAR